MVRMLFVETVLVDPRDLDPADEAMARALVERIGLPAELAALLAELEAQRRSSIPNSSTQR